LIDGAASIAAIAIVFVIFSNDLLGGPFSAVQVQLLAVGTIVIVALLSLASIHANGMIATVITAVKVLLVVGTGLAAFVLGGGSWENFLISGEHGTCEGVEANARLGATGFGAAVIGALWSYNGWVDLSFVAEEVRDPARTLPRAIIGGTLLII